MIRIPQVRVVDEEGEQLGVMPTPQALEMAQERGYDLVEVAPMASPPVARFLDFGQYKYELTKREKEAKRQQRSVTFKEVRLTPKIGIGDFDTKVRRAIEFLEDGDRIKVTVQFRGRELTHPEIGRALLEKFSDQIKDHGVDRAGTPPRGQVDVHHGGLDPQAEGARGSGDGRPDGPTRSGPADRSRPRTSGRRQAPIAPAADGTAARRSGTGKRTSRPQPPAPKAATPAPAPTTGTRTPRPAAPAATDAAPAARAAPKPRTREARRSAHRGARAGTDRRVRPHMPKMKSHKAAQKRIGVTGSGKVFRVRSWRGHHLEIKSSRRTRRYAGKSMVGVEHAAQVRRLLPYL